MAIQVSCRSERTVAPCVCRTPYPGVLFFLNKTSGGPGRIHRRLVNEAGDVSEDMEMGHHFHAEY